MSIKVDTHELVELQEQLEPKNIEKALDKAMKKLAGETMAVAKKNTPVDTGDLRRGWHVEQADHEMVKLQNNVEYAEYVEFGHRQNVGQYVPKIGKRLVNPWVEGVFYALRSENQMRKRAPRILKPVIEEELEKLVNG